ncbi:CocE/NonD family hydrolase [Nocardia salmonicida]|uniref:CocE/NonD family hydrolase n=1 Tax=Nocardia salmonicida TaxID=53431 RepID=UPI0036724E3E
MPEARQNRLRLLAPDQEAAASAVISDLLTGNAAGVPDYLVDDIAALRGRCRFAQVQIPGYGGDLLDGMAAWPTSGGPHALVVLPAGLDPAGWKMYSGALIRLLLRGYAVVAYTERGLPGSGGELTVAGPEDVADGSLVIDWALDHPEIQADPKRIGLAGISYGSGIGQLVAQSDPRVKAVVALSTWADLGEALYDNRTRHILAAEALAAISENPSAELVKVLEDFRTNTNIDGVLDYARRRSPAHIPDERRPVPTFFTSYWHETIFPQNQLLSYFAEFPGPKRLDLAIGDHGAVEIPGLLLGVYTRTTEAAYDWLDHYLNGVDNGIDDDGVVHTETMHSFTVSSSVGVEGWSSNPIRTYHLAAPASGSGDGALVLDPPSDLSRSIRSGDPKIRAVNQLVMDGFRERLLMPVRQKLVEVDRSAAAVWTSAPLPSPHHIAGIPRIRVTVTPTTKAATVVAYLFDLDVVTGNLKIITHAATTVSNVVPEHPTAVDLRLQATDYRVPAGQRLAVILATEDPLYAGETEPGTVVTLSAFHGAAAIDIPIAD